MRNMFAAPGWLLAYHKLLARFTIDMCCTINTLDRFSPDNLSPFSVSCYRNVQTIPREVGSWPLSSMLGSHSPRIMVRDARYMRERLDVDGLSLARLGCPDCLARLSCRRVRTQMCRPSKFCNAKKFS